MQLLHMFIGCGVFILFQTHVHKNVDNDLSVYILVFFPFMDGM